MMVTELIVIRLTHEHAKTTLIVYDIEQDNI